MVIIPKHVQDFLPGKWHGWRQPPVTESPTPLPKETLKLVDENHVLFADLFSL